MKKFLIAGTALVAAGLITTGAASASEKIKLNLGGYSKWWVVGAWNDSDYEAAITNGTAGQGSPASVDVKGDNEVFVGGSTTLDNGLKVGVDMQLEGNTDADQVDESYVWVEGGFGKVIVGSENGAAYLLHVTAPDAAGNWSEGGMLQNGEAIGKPTTNTSWANTSLITDGDAEKITYVTPTFYGLTVGVSYTGAATEDNRASFAGSGGAAGTFANNQAAEMYSVGALYADTFGGVGVKLSAGWLTYDTAATSDRSQEWSTGAQLSYAGFTLGGSYRDIEQNQGGDQANAPANAVTNTSGSGWDVGIQYASGPYAVSLAYFTSEVEGLVATQGQDTTEVYQLSGKYTLGAGVDVLASVGHVEFDEESAKTANTDINHNEGWAVMTGLSLAF